MPANPQNDLATEDLWRLTWRLSLPGVVGNIILSLGSFIDAVFLGYFLGEKALAGVSLVFPVGVLMTAFMALVSVGASSLLSRAIGAGDKNITQNVLSSVFTLSAIIAFLFTIIGYPLSGPIVKLMGAEADLLQIGTAYFKVWICGSFFYIFGLAANALIRAEGKIKEAMTISVISTGANVVLTPLFIYTLGWEVEGAAWSSVLSMALYTVLTLRYFFTGKTSVVLAKVRFFWQGKMVKDILHTGLSAFLLHGMNFIRQLVIFRLVVFYGTTADVAFFSAAYRAFMFLVSPAMGFMGGLMPVLGINYGAGNFERIKGAISTFQKGTWAFMTVFWLPLMLFPGFFLHFMLPDTTFSYEQLLNFRLILFAMPLIPFHRSGMILFQAVGNGKIATNLTFYRQALLFIPLIIVFPVLSGVNGIYYALILENALYALVMFLMTNRELLRLRYKLTIS